MRLQTKIVLTILPLTALSIIIVGLWSITTIKRSMESALEQLMIQEIDDFVTHTILRSYNTLDKNGLLGIDSFVASYQKKIIEESEGFHLLESGIFLIIDQSGTILNRKPDSRLNEAFLDQLLDVIDAESTKRTFGHFEDKNGHIIYDLSFFEPWQWTLVYAVSHDTVHKAQDKLIATSALIAVGCGVLISIIIILMFRSFFVKPITCLTETAADISQFKEVRQIDIHTTDELDALARSMEHIAGSIKKYKDSQENFQQHLESEIRRSTKDLNDANITLKREITHRKETERILRNNEERFEAIFESTKDCILVWDRDYNYLYANQAAIDHVGTSRDRVIGKNIRDGLGHVPDFMKLWMDRIDNAFISGTSFRVEDDVMVGDQQVHSESVVSPIFDSDGHIFAVGVVYRDVTERTRMEQRISEALHLNQEIISASTLGILAYREDGQCVLTNDAAVTIVGSDKNALLEQNFNHIESWEKTGLIQMAREVLATGIAEQFEMKTISSFDKPVWLDIRLTRFTLAGNPHLLLTLDDIFERKQMEQQITSSLKEKEILLKEIHHRVKNNLQIVSGLLKMQAAHFDDPRILDGFKAGQGQILSMALVHEQLYNSDNLARISFKTYLKDLVRSLQVSYGIDIDRIKTVVDCPNLFIGIDTAIPCGLIVNELITNSFKYAFAEGEPGEITISFQPKGDEHLHLLVTDTGCGLPDDLDITRTRSLGLKLVYNLVTHQLEGDIKLLKFQGTGFSITFPYNSKPEADRLALSPETPS